MVNVVESFQASAGAVQTEFLPGDFKMNEIQKSGGANAL
jgi:hypothetical protein